jgi:hypothetical protein
MNTGGTLPHHESQGKDLMGAVSINLEEGQDFNALGASLAGYDPAHFEAVALRVFIENTPVVTVYALDKARASRAENTDKLPVRKFKKEISFEELFSKLRLVNFTVSTGEYNIDDMEVVNR